MSTKRLMKNTAASILFLTSSVCFAGFTECFYSWALYDKDGQLKDSWLGWNDSWGRCSMDPPHDAPWNVDTTKWKKISYSFRETTFSAPTQVAEERCIVTIQEIDQPGNLN